MTEDQVFLRGSDLGIARASRDGEGGWSVEDVLSNVNVACMAQSPTKAAVVYAGEREGGVWRSEDRGETWERVGGVAESVMALAVSPHDSQLIYAGTKGALMFVSRDAGSTWSELEGFRRIPNRWWWFSPAEPPDWRPYVIAIAISPTEPDTVLAGIEFGGVVRSEDGGDSWTRHRRGALRDCHSLKFHAKDGDWVYEAGGTGGGASFSRDGGQRFQKAKHGLAKNYGMVCAADPVKPEVWYVGVAPSPYNAYGEEPEIYLYRSTAGAAWQPIGWAPHPLPETPTTLVTLTESPGHLYAGLRSGDIWRSGDYGDNWEKMPFNMKEIWGSLIIV
jgi:photosystem II stability/assembly factor-like uncharacterized protein